MTDASFPSGGNNIITTGWNGSNDYTNIYTSGNSASDVAAKITILNSGNVGIGTMGPGQKLDVNGNLLIEGGNTLYLGNYLTLGGNQFNVPVGCPYCEIAFNYGGYSNAAFSFFNGGGTLTSRIYGAGGMWTNGNISANYVSLNASSVGNVSLNLGDGSHPGYTALFNNSGTRIGYIGWQCTSGYLCLETENGYSGYEATGNLRVDGGNIYSGTRSNFYLAMQSDRNMVLYDNGGAVWASNSGVSDIRLKEQIKPLEDVIPSLMKLHAIRFRYKKSLDEDQKPQIGVIAQEVEKYFPEFVYHARNDRLLVNYDKLTAVLLKGMQELKFLSDMDHARVEDELAKIKADNDDLRAELKAADDNQAARLKTLEDEIARMKTAAVKGKEVAP